MQQLFNFFSCAGPCCRQWAYRGKSNLQKLLPLWRAYTENNNNNNNYHYHISSIQKCTVFSTSLKSGCLLHSLWVVVWLAVFFFLCFCGSGIWEQLSWVLAQGFSGSCSQDTDCGHSHLKTWLGLEDLLPRSTSKVAHSHGWLLLTVGRRLHFLCTWTSP